MKNISVSRSAAILALALLLAPSMTAAPSVHIDPAKTWVGLARVHLEVSEIRLSDHELEGAYRIRVPLSPRENDTGTLHLRTDRTIDEVRRTGGKLGGTVRSDSGATWPLACELQPDGKLQIEIATERRTVSFKTRFHVR